MAVVNLKEPDIFMISELLKAVDPSEIDWSAVAGDSGRTMKHVRAVFASFRRNGVFPLPDAEMQTLLIALFRPVKRQNIAFDWNRIISNVNRRADFEILKTKESARRRFQTLQKTMSQAQRGEYSAAVITRVVVIRPQPGSRNFVNISQVDFYMLSQMSLSVSTCMIDWSAVGRDLDARSARATYCTLKRQGWFPYTSTQVEIMVSALFSPLSRHGFNLDWRKLVTDTNRQAGFTALKDVTHARRRYKALEKLVHRAKRGKYTAPLSVSVLMKSGAKERGIISRVLQDTEEDD